MSTLWNPADKDSAITLTNTNHTAGATAGGNFGVRSTGVTKSSGKVYVEFTNVQFTGAGGGEIGCANSTDTLGGGGQFGLAPSGALDGRAGQPAGSVGASPWTAVGLAIDLTSGFYWATVDGTTWHGSGVGTQDPVAGTNGRDITTFVGPLMLHVWFQVLSNTYTATLNAGDNAFSFTVPSGFTAWDAPVPTPPRSYVTVMA